MTNQPHKWDGGRVRCPACERENWTDHLANLCLCGRWFEVDPDDGSTRVIAGPDEVLPPCP